jgi:hypothetical protein
VVEGDSAGLVAAVWALQGGGHDDAGTHAVGPMRAVVSRRCSQTAKAWDSVLFQMQR